jgi:hypothetical protein
LPRSRSDWYGSFSTSQTLAQSAEEVSRTVIKTDAMYCQRGLVPTHGAPFRRATVLLASH